ncbi:WXG100 family type VII secretion target [Streptomyces sp. NPDC048331]|uniref:WXG100 family type VII secretion target n=1 Tax=unclassified Streptomyces TaxID=2593676 RepID=UPI003437C4AC
MPDWGGLLDKGLEKLDDGWEGAKKVVGQGVDKATDGIGAGLEYVGADDWADKVEDWGDDVASDLGASVGEQQLGQSEQANELVHGKPAKIRESAKHLTDFQGAFDRVGQGMRALDSGHWKGQAADAFRTKFAMHPKDWLHASDACEAAARALNRYAETVEWAQKQAQQAIDLYKAAVKAAKEAHEDYATKAHAYTAAAEAGKNPGPVPQKPVDVGKADGTRAHEILNEARKQRDEAAANAAKALDAALEHAPKEPSATDRALAGISDHFAGQAVELNHFVGGVVKGTAGLLNFARGLNPMDPYNLTHPAEYQQNLNMTLAGLVSTAAHPERIPAGLIETLKGDFSEGLGRFVPDLLGTKGLGGARAGTRLALREGLEGAAGTGLRHADEWLTGGRRRPRQLLDDPAQTKWAEDAYADFMKSDRDIDSISGHTQGLARDNGSTGFTPEEIAAVKKHVFDTEHPIVDYETGGVVMRKFDADAEIADAWIRLRSGNGLPEDRLLLEHELAELTYLREHPGSTYQEAHRVANETHNWQESGPQDKREDIEGEW